MSSDSDPPSIDDAAAPSIDDAAAPSIDDAAAPSIDDQFNVRRGTLYQNKKRKPRWEYTKIPIPTVPDEASYNKADIDEMVAEIYRAIQTSDDYHSKRLDDIYYTFNNIISWLTIHTYEMKQDIVIIQKQHAVGAGASKTIDDHTRPSIDAHLNINRRFDLHHSKIGFNHSPTDLMVSTTRSVTISIH
ncbi:hypothetical protein F2Q68_00035501 [Brassica cretica]|uniref:Uncharacterized protein n=1 Tax=Brassica cretica TaxID=69181 RepID=A0A8S9H405_BRACR|nr:hypothetical protein F2Q68_00035501 [Brassica cretica]